jgi:hypothetical protein
VRKRLIVVRFARLLLENVLSVSITISIPLVVVVVVHPIILLRSSSISKKQIGRRHIRGGKNRPSAARATAKIFCLSG